MRPSLAMLGHMSKRHFLLLSTLVLGPIITGLVLWNVHNDHLPLTVLHVIPIILICHLGGALWGLLMWYVLLRPAQERAASQARAGATSHQKE